MSVHNIKGNVSQLPVVDSTLTRSGYSADAKATGDAIAENKQRIEREAARLDSELDVERGKIDQIANNQIPEEYLKAAVDAYVEENTAGLATQESLETVESELKSDLSELTETLENHLGNVSANIYNKNTNTVGFSINSSGVLVENASYMVSDFIEIGEGGTFSFHPIGEGTTGVITISTYDSNGVFQRRIPLNTDTTNVTLKSYESKVRFNIYTVSDDFMTNMGDTLLPYAPYGFNYDAYFEETKAQAENNKERLDKLETEQTVNRILYSRDIADTFTIESTPTHNFNAETITTAEIYALYDELLNAYPDFIWKEVIGYGVDGQEIRCYHIQPLRVTAPTNRYIPNVVVCCGHHGWEKASAETMLLILRKMMNEWQSDKILEVLRFDVKWHIIPVVNTSGWDLQSRKNTNHVDLNRNYAEGWDYRESDESATTYQGESALSESETQAVANFLNRTTFDIGVDFHDFGVANTNQMMWIEYQNGSIEENQIAQTYIERVSRLLCKQFSYLSSVEPYTLGYVSETGLRGMCLNALKARTKKYAYTFEVGGVMAHEDGVIRYSDDHVKACVQAFTNFIAINLDALKR